MYSALEDEDGRDYWLAYRVFGSSHVLVGCGGENRREIGQGFGNQSLSLDRVYLFVQVGANKDEFLKGLVYWFAIALPATFTNSMIKYLQSLLEISLRSTLTEHVQNVYLAKRTYYKAINLDRRLDSLDQ